MPGDAAPASRRARVAAGAGGLGALAYGGLKADWAAGGTLGLRGEPPWKTRTGGWAQAGDGVRFLAFEGTVILALLAVLLLLALAHPAGRRLPRRLLASLAWLGCALVGGIWVLGTANLMAGSTGPGSDPTLAPATFWVLWASFGALGSGFGLTAWWTRPDRG